MSNFILIVEDDDDARALVEMILTNKGYVVKGCAGGREALEVLEKANKPALVLLDVMMPEVNGYDVLVSMKQKPETQNIPVIMLTAKSQGDDIISGYQHGADYYIPKPFTSEQLLYGISLFL
ncbi:MAG: response regulator [Deltaproteobacteria bacterium]|nr:response regulator [Deltaproteobacteria bacterium]